MKRKTAQCLAAFALSAILILALAGFLAVDLGAERDMPGEYEPALRLSGISAEGAKLSLFGEDYYFVPELLTPAKEAAWRFRGLLPPSVQGAGRLVVWAYNANHELKLQK